MSIHFVNYLPIFQSWESIESTDVESKALRAVPLLHNIFFAVKIAQFEGEEKMRVELQKLITDASHWKWVNLITLVALASIAYFVLTPPVALLVASVVLLAAPLLLLDIGSLESLAKSLCLPPPPPELREIELTDGRVLRVYPTVGDGSCAFHALFGEMGSDGYYRCDAKAKREEFCDWLQIQFDEKKLPTQIKNSLENYFKFFDTQELDAKLKTDLQIRYDEFHDGYEKLSKEIQEHKEELFISCPEVFEAYLKHMRKVTTCLSQPELIVVGICFKKGFYLCQPGWYNDSSKNTYIECNEKEIFQTDPTYIWYDGYRHFEGAHLVKKEQP